MMRTKPERVSPPPPLEALSPSLARLLDNAKEPDRRVELAFLARQFVQATLPHRNPGDLPLWKRTNGKLTLAIQPGMNIETGKSYGYPYGTLPRLLLFWMTTEAITTKSRRLELGHTLTDFMRELGLNPNNGSRNAKRSDARRLTGQMERLFRATISFQESDNDGRRAGKAWVDMQVAPEGMLWWDLQQPEQGTLWGSWVQLGERFYEAITAAPVPVDMRALRALKRSPLALDVYAWATYTAYQTQRTEQSRLVEWAWLHEQFGADYAELKEFTRKAKAALRKVQVVYPAFGMAYERGGIRVLPCSPAVTLKRKDSVPASPPTPSLAAQAAFRVRHPGRDLELCLDAWRNFLVCKGTSPYSADAHFLAFAAKWA